MARPTDELIRPSGRPRGVLLAGHRPPRDGDGTGPPNEPSHRPQGGPDVFGPSLSAADLSQLNELEKKLQVVRDYTARGNRPASTSGAPAVAARATPSSRS